MFVFESVGLMVESGHVAEA